MALHPARDTQTKKSRSMYTHTRTHEKLEKFLRKWNKNKQLEYTVVKPSNICDEKKKQSENMKVHSSCGKWMWCNEQRKKDWKRDRTGEPISCECVCMCMPMAKHNTNTLRFRPFSISAFFPVQHTALDHMYEQYSMQLQDKEHRQLFTYIPDS